mgnify:CR=1 FL=1
MIQCIARWVPTLKCVESRRAAEGPTTIFDPYRAVVKAPKAPAKCAPRQARLLHKLDGARAVLRQRKNALSRERERQQAVEQALQRLKAEKEMRMKQREALRAKQQRRLRGG